MYPYEKSYALSKLQHAVDLCSPKDAVKVGEISFTQWENDDGNAACRVRFGDTEKRKAPHGKKWRYHSHGGYSNQEEVDEWLSSCQPTNGWEIVGASLEMEDAHYGEIREVNVYHANGVIESWITVNGNVSSQGETYLVSS